MVEFNGWCFGVQIFGDFVFFIVIIRAMRVVIIDLGFFFIGY